MFPSNETDPEVTPALSRFIAGLIGPVLAALGCTMLLNRELTAHIAAEIPNSLGLILFSGVSLLVAGLAVVQCHATWRGWPALITALGWLSIVSGIVRILFPSQLASIASMLGAPFMSGLIAPLLLALGAFLTFKAFISTDQTK